MSYYIIIRGPLGCGKSTISERLAKELGAQHVAVDRVLDEHNLTEEKEEGYISQNSFKKANQIIATEARETIDAGTPIIFDGNFYWQSAIEDLIARLPYPHEVFTLTAPLETCIERDKARDKTHGKDAAAVVYNKSTSFSYGVEIDATQPIEKTLEEIKSKINIKT